MWHSPTQLQMKRWGFLYIENLTWVYLRPNNSMLTLVRLVGLPIASSVRRPVGYAAWHSVVRSVFDAYMCVALHLQPGDYVNCSHLTLYMFRKATGGKDIELRHQRNPDVTFDCLAKELESEWLLAVGFLGPALAC